MTHLCFWTVFHSFRDIYYLVYIQGPICKKNIAGVANSRRRRRRVTSAEGARRWGVGRGCPPSHWGRNLCPLPRNFFIFHLKIVSFSAFWGVFYHFSAALFTAKISVFWLTEHFSIYCIIKWRVLVDCDVLHVLLIVVVKLETCM